MYSLKTLSLFLNKLAGCKRTGAWSNRSTRQSRPLNNWGDKTKLYFEQWEFSDLRCWLSSPTLPQSHPPIPVFGGEGGFKAYLVYYCACVAWRGVSNNGLTQKQACTIVATRCVCKIKTCNWTHTSNYMQIHPKQALSADVLIREGTYLTVGLIRRARSCLGNLVGVWTWALISSPLS